MVVPFSIDEPTKASWYISVTTDSNGICTVTAILPPLRSHRLATGYVAERRAARCDHGQVASPIGQEQDRHPSQEGRTASCLSRRVGLTSRGSRSTVDIVSCTPLAKTTCVDGGTHPNCMVRSGEEWAER